MSVYKRYIILFVPLICLLTQHCVAAVTDSSQLFRLYEDTLKQLQYGRVNEQSTDKQKEEANTRFTALLQKALELPNSFNYPFDSLTTIARLTSDDKQFRIINWNLPKYDGTQEYFGFIQSLDHKTKHYKLYTLTDKSAEISNPQSKVLTPADWLGMLYYKVITVKEGSRTLYMLLAWQGYNNLVTRKIIDVISFNSEGAPSFGKAIFSHLPSEFRGSPKRLIFEYSATASMSLEYDPAKDMIVFDHLEPTTPGLEGQYEYYAPSLIQVDGLAYKNGKWDYKTNVEARNPALQTDKMYHSEKDGDVSHHKKAIYTPH